jgi:NAD(P)-dependent dehydrogenase (short-subunit alcohol dehydrogenase family)
MIVVAGASSGIGLGISKKLKAAGNQIFGVARRDLKDIPGGIDIFDQYARVDLSAKNFEIQLMGDISQFKSEVVGWVNNIGKSAWKNIGEIEFNFIDEMVRTNLISQIMLCKCASQMPNLRSIVNIGSIAGRRGSKNNVVYSSSKFAINGLTQSLAKELGHNGIRVNTVSPVMVATEGLLAAFGAGNSPSGDTPPESFLKTFSSNETALNRLPSIDEVSDVVEWLLSSKSSAVTGQNINVDCGVFPQ